jgi:hypothetical protein
MYVYEVDFGAYFAGIFESKYLIKMFKFSVFQGMKPLYLTLVGNILLGLQKKM